MSLRVAEETRREIVPAIPRWQARAKAREEAQEPVVEDVEIQDPADEEEQVDPVEQVVDYLAQLLERSKKDREPLEKLRKLAEEVKLPPLVGLALLHCVDSKFRNGRHIARLARMSCLSPELSGDAQYEVNREPTIVKARKLTMKALHVYLKQRFPKWDVLWSRTYPYL